MCLAAGDPNHLGQAGHFVRHRVLAGSGPLPRHHRRLRSRPLRNGLQHMGMDVPSPVCACLLRGFYKGIGDEEVLCGACDCFVSGPLLASPSRPPRCNHRAATIQTAPGNSKCSESSPPPLWLSMGLRHMLFRTDFVGLPRCRGSTKRTREDPIVQNSPTAAVQAWAMPDV
eukprot:15467814-Alexandrium_andersonii.AAC.1